MILVLLVVLGGLGWGGWAAWEKMNAIGQEKYHYHPNRWEWTAVLGVAQGFLASGISMASNDLLSGIAGVLISLMLFGVTFYCIQRKTSWQMALGSVALQTLAAIGAVIALFLAVIAAVCVVAWFFGCDSRKVVVVREY